MSVAAIYQIVTPFTEADLPGLRYEQTGDTIMLTCLGHFPQRLQRFDHNDWRIANAPIGQAAAKPATASAVATANYVDTVNGGYTEQDYQYAVSSVDEATGREGEATDTGVVQNDLGTRPGSPDGNFNTITWDAVAGALLYRVYRKKNGNYGYVGSVNATEALDAETGGGDGRAPGRPAHGLGDIHRRDQRALGRRQDRVRAKSGGGIEGRAAGAADERQGQNGGGDQEQAGHRAALHDAPGAGRAASVA